MLSRRILGFSLLLAAIAGCSAGGNEEGDASGGTGIDGSGGVATGASGGNAGSGASASGGNAGSGASASGGDAGSGASASGGDAGNGASASGAGGDLVGAGGDAGPGGAPTGGREAGGEGGAGDCDGDDASCPSNGLGPGICLCEGASCACTGLCEHDGNCTEYAESPTCCGGQCRASCGGGGSGGTGGTGGFGASGGTGGGCTCSAPPFCPSGCPETGGAGGIPDLSGGTGGISDPAVQCFGTANPVFPTFDKSCGDAGDCALVSHVGDCCGTELRMAINPSESDRFAAAEATCRTQYPPCGCAAQGIFAEDGARVDFGDEDSIVAACLAGQCTSVYGGNGFPCGPITCTEQQYCETNLPGTGGTTSYYCGPTPCTECSCLSPRPGCTCSDSTPGELRVLCDGV